MNYKISFKERAEMGKQILSKKSPVTLEQAKQQVQEMKQRSTQSNKKNSLTSFITQNRNSFN